MIDAAVIIILVVLVLCNIIYIRKRKKKGLSLTSCCQGCSGCKNSCTRKANANDL